MRVEATVPLFVRDGILAMPAERTVLHGMLQPDADVFIRVGFREVRVPKPDLPVVDEGSGNMVVLGPPWSIMNRILVARARGDVEMEERQQQQLVTWLAAAYRRALGRCQHYELPGFMGAAIAHPVVPKGEVWLASGHVGELGHATERGIAVRYPVASSTSVQHVRIRVVKNADICGVLIHPDTLVEDMQGDSDGDLVMVGFLDGDPAPGVELGNEIPIEFAECNVDFCEPKNMSIQELVLGYAAKSGVGGNIGIGLATWMTWRRSRTAADLYGTNMGWSVVYDEYTDVIESIMDARKHGSLEIDTDLSPLHPLPPLHGVAAMMFRRRIDTSVPAGSLVRDFWRLQWSGATPERVPVMEVCQR